MEELIEQLKLGDRYFHSGSYNTPEFNKFYNKFKVEFKKLLKGIDGFNKLIISKGHFYLSGFIVINRSYYYFSISDVRSPMVPGELLVRTAKHDKDYTGGINNYVMLDNFVEEFKRTFNL